MKASLLFLLLIVPSFLKAECSGKFPNIISDICWECVFPIRIGATKVTSGDDAGGESGTLLCLCPKPPLNQPTPGIRISFWEPVRLMDVTRHPYCLVNLGGLKLGNSSSVKDRGSVTLTEGEGGLKNSFLHVHWYVFPVFYIFELLTDFICAEKQPFDLAWLTEFDPLWNRDEWALLQNPEALLFGNLAAQGACAADCAKTATGWGFDTLFWCAGCHGSIYPFTGSVPGHITAVQATELVGIKFMAMMHRRGLLRAYLGSLNICGASVCPIIKKSMYRLQMLNPIPAPNFCNSLGKSDFLFPLNTQREILHNSLNYGYLVWRRRECCIL
jgi:conjugal transfer pilus assembly protein TraU